LSFYFLEGTACVKLFVQEAGTNALIGLMEATEDNRKLISASTPLEIYATIRKRERSHDITQEDAAAALSVLRLESARMVQQPLNPAVLEAARQLLDRSSLRWPDTLQLGAAVAARDMFQGTEIVFVSSSAQLLEAAANEGFKVLDPEKDLAEPAKDSEQGS
jgi:predicted nucleic acid-binding protein